MFWEFLASITPILCLGCIALVILIYDYKETRLKKKSEALIKFIEKDYEIEHIDLNKFFE